VTRTTKSSVPAGQYWPSSKAVQLEARGLYAADIRRGAAALADRSSERREQHAGALDVVRNRHPEAGPWKPRLPDEAGDCPAKSRTRTVRPRTSCKEYLLGLD